MTKALQARCAVKLARVWGKSVRRSRNSNGWEKDRSGYTKAGISQNSPLASLKIKTRHQTCFRCSLSFASILQWRCKNAQAMLLLVLKQLSLKEMKKTKIQVPWNVSRTAALIPLIEFSSALGIILYFCQSNTSALCLIQSHSMPIQILPLTSVGHGWSLKLLS